MNAPSCLKIPTPDGSGQATHPDVLYVPAGFLGYRYWMACTPYPFAADRLENPIVRVSQDGIRWQVFPGAPDPLVGPPSEATWHHADTDLVLHDDVLYVFYISTNREAAETTFSYVSTRDGLSWTAPHCIYEGAWGVSPAVLVDSEQRWHIWYVERDALARAQKSSLFQRTGSSARSLGAPALCALRVPNHVVWHIDVAQVDGHFEALISAFPLGTEPSRCHLFHAVSDDGLRFELSSDRPLLRPSWLGWDNRMIYRSTFVGRDGRYQIWYSAASWGMRCGIGLLRGSLDNLQPVVCGNAGHGVPLLRRLLEDLVGVTKYAIYRALSPTAYARLLSARNLVRDVTTRKLPRTSAADDPGDSGILRHVVVLMSWTVVAQVVSVVSMLILPRLFQPEQFGVFSVFSGVVVMLGIVAAVRYEFAIGLPSSDTDGAALFTLCVMLTAATSLVWLTVFLGLPAGNWLFLKFPELRPWWAWVALGVGCVGWYNAASYLALRAGRFDTVGKSKTAIAVSTAAGQILAAGFIGRSDGSLIVPYLLGQLCGVALILHALPGRHVLNTKTTALVAMSRRYARFPKFVAFGSLMDGVAALLPVAVISAAFSPAEAGIYALAERTLKMPVTLIGSSVLQVFYKRLADLRNDRNAVRDLLLRTWVRLALAAALPCVVIAFWGEALFAGLFGSAWQESGRVSEILVVAVSLYFVSYPTSNILVVNERVKSFVGWQAAQLLVVASVLFIGLHAGHQSLQMTVALLVCGQVGVYILWMVLQWAVVATPHGGRQFAATRRG